MQKLHTKDLVKIVEVMTEVILKNEVYFCELDSVAGDGDFGMSLAKGFRELKKARTNLLVTDMGAYLKGCSQIISEHCGGASGPIWGSAFWSAGKFAEGKTELGLTDLSLLMQAAVDGIQKRGGAKLGDKTLLDALIPATESLKASALNRTPLLVAMRGSAEAAVAGAEQTKLIRATKGRASYVGERSLSFPDAGAMALGILFTEIAFFMETQFQAKENRMAVTV